MGAGHKTPESKGGKGKGREKIAGRPEPEKGVNEHETCRALRRVRYRNDNKERSGSFLTEKSAESEGRTTGFTRSERPGFETQYWAVSPWGPSQSAGTIIGIHSNGGEMANTGERPNRRGEKPGLVQKGISEVHP